MNLYHFTKLDTAIRFILPYMELRMNSSKYMNDPKENLLHKAEFWEYNQPGMLDEASIANYAGNETKILSFSIDDKSKNRMVYKRQKMWWEYAESHSGICLKLDYDLLIEENLELIQKYSIINDCVEYNDHPFDFINIPMHGKIKNSNEDINLSLTPKQQWEKDKTNPEYIKARYFTKHNDWKDENEFRFVTLTTESEIHLSIKKSLKTIFIGLLTNRNYLPSIEKLTKCNMKRLMFFNGDLEIK